jgi:hypothetical protein
MHAPVLSQPVAPHTGSPVTQETLQQLPVPLMPQMPDWHCWFPVQGLPPPSETYSHVLSDWQKRPGQQGRFPFTPGRPHGP